LELLIEDYFLTKIIPNYLLVLFAARLILPLILKVMISWRSQIILEEGCSL